MASASQAMGWPWLGLALASGFRFLEPSQATKAMAWWGAGRSGPDSPSNHADRAQPWLDGFKLYLNVREAVPEGMASIVWWGLNADRYSVPPVNGTPRVNGTAGKNIVLYQYKMQ
ncbi:hypothetical protein DFH09DRAFT_1089858 [Mycena vulgaris]|nr:hypothetical protein DFH09DRAFT_1089858 [Mycena vulgaris]